MVNVKLPKTVRLKTYVGTTLVLAVLLLASVGYVLTSNGTTVTITPQSYTETASYIIFKQGSYYYAINGSTGEIEFSGTNATQVIQNAVGTARTLYLKAGTYQLTSTLTLPDDITIIGESNHDDSGAVLSLNSGATINVQNAERVHLENLVIYGNNAAVGITAGNDTGRNGDFYFSNVVIRNCTYGLYVATTTGFYDSTFIECNFVHCTKAGVYLKELMNTFIGCSFSRNKVGVEFGQSTTGHWAKFDNCVFSGNDYDFNVTGTSGNFLASHCWFENEGYYSVGYGNGNVFTYAGSKSVGVKLMKFDNCFFSSKANINLTWFDAFCINTLTFENCLFQNWDDLSHFDVPSISGNDKYPNLINCRRINTTGHSFWVLTINSGTFSSISNGTYVAHGLVGTPDVVTITLTVQGYAWIGATNSTHFQVYANVATISGSWYAEYKP